MRLMNFKMPNSFNLFGFGDDHGGNVFRHHEGVRMLVDAMNSKWGGLPSSKNYGIHHGDIADGIFMGDKRFDPRSQEFLDSLYSQARNCVKSFEPVKEKLIGLLDGNHSNSPNVRRFGNISRQVAKDLEIPFLTYQSVITYVSKNKKNHVLFKHFAGHGWGSVKSVAEPDRRARANREIALIRKLKRKAADTILMTMGHTHMLEVAKPDQNLFLNYRGGKIQQKFTDPDKYYGEVEYIPENLRWYANTGAFLKLYQDTNEFMEEDELVSGYAEQAGYDPIPLGFVVVEVRDRKIVDIKKVVPDSRSGLIILNN